MSPSISETLRQMCRHARGRSLTEDDIAVRALADRLSLEGEPRLGDLVRIYSMPDEIRNRAVVIATASDSARIAYVYFDGIAPSEWRLFEELRIIARAGYDCESGRELTP